MCIVYALVFIFFESLCISFFQNFWVKARAGKSSGHAEQIRYSLAESLQAIYLFNFQLHYLDVLIWPEEVRSS